MGSLFDSLSLTTNTTTINAFCEVLIPGSLFLFLFVLPFLSITAPTFSPALGLPAPAASQGLPPPPPGPALPPDIPDVEPTPLTDVQLASIFPSIADGRACE